MTHVGKRPFQGTNMRRDVTQHNIALKMSRLEGLTRQFKVYFALKDPRALIARKRRRVRSEEAAQGKWKMGRTQMQLYMHQFSTLGKSGSESLYNNLRELVGDVPSDVLHDLHAKVKTCLEVNLSTDFVPESLESAVVHICTSAWVPARLPYHHVSAKKTQVQCLRATRSFHNKGAWNDSVAVNTEEGTSSTIAHARLEIMFRVLGEDLVLIRWYEEAAMSETSNLLQGMSDPDTVGTDFVPGAKRVRLRSPSVVKNYDVIRFENIIRKQHVVPIPRFVHLPDDQLLSEDPQYEGWALLNPWMWSHETYDV